MKRLKKILTSMISMVLVIAMVGTSCVFADNRKSQESDILPTQLNNDNGTREENSVFLYKGHGEFAYVNKNEIGTDKELSSIRTVLPGGYISAANEDDTIFNAGEGKYLVYSGEGAYLLCDKIEFSVAEIENAILEHTDKISPEITAIIRSEAQTCIERGKTEGLIEAYVPSNLFDGVMTQPKGVTDTNTTSYYTYNGYSMKSITTRTDSKTTGLILNKQGTQVLGIAQSVTGLILSAIGVVSKTVSIFGVGCSAYSVYANIFGDVVTAMGNDEVRTAEIYDKYNRVTYVQLSGLWVAGAISYRVVVKHAETYEYYQSKGKGELIYTYMYDAQKSAHYDNEAAIAITYATSVPAETYVDDPIRCKLYQTWVVM